MFSELNPEAPEFFPHFQAITQDGFKTISKSILASNVFPAGDTYDTFKTLTDFNLITAHFNKNVLQQSNKVLAAELQVIRLKSNDEEHNTEKVIEANDNLLDRANTNIDVATGLTKPKDKGTDSKDAPSAVCPWNVSPIVTKVQMGSVTLIGAKNITRPQLNFREPIDNSPNLWVPKIADKPNCIKPLTLKILYNGNGEAFGYEHPYKHELGVYEPPPEFLAEGDEAPSPPPPPALTPLTLVDTEEALDRLVEHLRGVREIAVDVEHHSYRTYQGLTCLIQLSTAEGGDYLVDALALRHCLHKLNAAFTDPAKLKVFHGADNDILWLQRDGGVYVVGMFDTYRAARALRLPALSLKHLLLRYCGVDVDKRYQLADWRMRPLPAELVEYARQDTHYLLYLARRLRRELRQLGAATLRGVFRQSAHLCGLTYSKEPLVEDAHTALYVRSRKSFNSRQLSALRLLYRWRDAQARELDESTSYLLPNHMLLSLAETLPREVQGVAACCNPMPPFLKQNVIAVHRMLLSCREMPLEPQLYRMSQALTTMAQQEPTPAHTIHDLAHLPDFRDDLPVALTAEKKDSACADDTASACDLATPDVPLFQHSCNRTTLVSELNAEAKSFIPPFDRYRKFRTLAQIEELKEFKQKEAKIAALCRDDDLIKDEVLTKIQQATQERSEPEPAIEYRNPKERAADAVAPQAEAVSGKQRRENARKQTTPYAYPTDYKRFHDDSRPPPRANRKARPRKQ